MFDTDAGPVITKVVKSNLNEQMSSDTGHTVNPQVPYVAPAEGCVQYVIFSLLVEPQAEMINVQHTPNPSAQDPEEVPSLSEHSADV
jgi:hypothetical protein